MKDNDFYKDNINFGGLFRKRILASDPPSTVTDKKNVLTAIVGRYKKRVDESISNAGKGEFP